MSLFNTIAGFFVGALLWPFDRPWTGLVAAALATAVLLLLVIRGTSSAPAIRRSKGRLIARVLELVLFRHDALVSFTAGGRIVAANMAYLRTLVLPLVCSALPCVVILVQLSCWFAARPLRVGEAALLEVTLRDGFRVAARPVAVSAPPNVSIETDALRISRLAEVDWRLRARRDGVDRIEIQVEGEPAVSKQIVVGGTLQKVSRRRTGLGLWEQFLNPAEPPLDRDSSVVQVDVRYPARQLELGRWDIDWIVAFVALTMIFGIVLKRPLGVQL